MSRLERIVLSLVAPLLLLVALQGARLGQRGAAEPPELSVEQMLRSEGWAEEQGWRIARLKGNPRVVVVEFPSVAERNAALGRVAGPGADRVHRAGELLHRLEHPGASGAASTAQEKRLQTLLQSWPGGETACKLARIMDIIKLLFRAQCSFHK